MTTFLRLLDVPVEHKSAVLRAASQAAAQPGTNSTLQSRVFERDPSRFRTVPGSPFAYWVSDTVLAAFTFHSPFDRNYFAVRGAYTTDDFKYYRLLWEIPAHARGSTRDATRKGKPYVPLAKGGAFSPFHADVHLAIRWHDDGAEAKAYLAAYRERKGWGTDWSACLNGYAHYFRPGLTWPRRTNGLSFRVMPGGCIFADKGPAAFVEGDSPTEILALCAVMNSAPFGYLVAVQLARTELAQSYEVGLIQQTPVPNLSDADVGALAELARRAWALKRRLDAVNETSHSFVLPAAGHGYKPLPPVSPTIARLRRNIEEQLAGIQHAIDDRAFELYRIGTEDRKTIEAAMSRSMGSSVMGDDEVDIGEEEEEPTVETSSTRVELAINSWFVGVAFGRFDKRLATGERDVPPEPEPFDPLPARSPGMWPEGEPRKVEPPPILVDDPGEKADIVAHVHEAAAYTGWAVPDDIRPWLARDFFPFHISMYSKSRRKAPIYWQLATPSASYSVWLYIHAFSKDTFYKVQNDYAIPKLQHEERRLENLRRELGDNPKAADRKTLAAQETFVDELRAFVDEVKRITPLWNPDLDDGVILNFAPLWRLVPHHKPWQKELKATWDALAAGDYDWAHLAMHLWPERVVPRCATDRSLAIAHGLEDTFWFEDAGKWKPRQTPTQPIQDIVQARTSPAVKAALQSLLEAPVAQGTSKPSRRKGAK